MSDSGAARELPRYTVEDLTGQCADVMVETHHEPGVRLRPETFEAFKRMERAAGRDGVPLWLFSGFRSLSEQTAFWNDCMEGRRDADLSSEGVPAEDETETERLAVLMKWVAVPGTSRHHWGTDVDILGYHPVLFPEGYRERRRRDFMPGGMYERQYRWLLGSAGKFQFVQPYEVYRGGVEMEPWHWSYAPLSVPMLSAYRTSRAADVIREHPFARKEVVMPRWEWYIETFVTNINPALL